MGSCHDQRATNWYRDDLYSFFVARKEGKDRSLFASLSIGFTHYLSFDKINGSGSGLAYEILQHPFSLLNVFSLAQYSAKHVIGSSNLSNTAKLLFSCKVQTTMNAVP